MDQAWRLVREPDVDLNARVGEAQTADLSHNGVGVSEMGHLRACKC